MTVVLTAISVVGVIPRTQNDQLINRQLKKFDITAENTDYTNMSFNKEVPKF